MRFFPSKWYDRNDECGKQGMIMTYFFIGIGGIVGSLLRYLISNLNELYFMQDGFPFGTLAANLTGAFLIGIFTRTFTENEKVNRTLILSIGTGAIGSYTTMSTLSTETIRLIEHGEIILAVLYIVISLIGGLAASWFGYYRTYRKARI